MCAHHPTFDLARVACFTCHAAARNVVPIFVRAQQGPGPRSLSAHQIAHRARMLDFLSQSTRAQSDDNVWRAACNGQHHAAVGDAAGRR
jgi:hypothetical protein